MTARYDRSGLCFQYPENWRLEEDATDRDAPAARDGSDSVTIYSPGGSFWTVVRHAGARDPQALVEASLRTMKEEYENLDAEPAEETISGHPLSGYDLNFFCLDVTNTTRIRGLKTADSAVLIFCQADDRELAEIDGVFQAITTSLLSNLAASKQSSWPPR